MGHDVELLHPKAVKPFVQGGKSDKNDAAGIYAAMRQPHVTRVGIKSIETQNISTMLTIREGVVKEKVIHINRVHGILLEYGIVVSKGKKFTQEAEKALETLGERCGQNAFLLQEIQDEIQAVRDCIKRLNRLENALEKMLEGNDEDSDSRDPPLWNFVTSKNCDDFRGHSRCLNFTQRWRF